MIHCIVFQWPASTISVHDCEVVFFLYSIHLLFRSHLKVTVSQDLPSSPCSMLRDSKSKGSKCFIALLIRKSSSPSWNVSIPCHFLIRASYSDVFPLWTFWKLTKLLKADSKETPQVTFNWHNAVNLSHDWYLLPFSMAVAQNTSSCIFSYLTDHWFL